MCKSSPTKITGKRKSSESADTTAMRRKKGSSVNIGTPMGKTKPSASDSTPDTAKQVKMRGPAKKSNEHRPVEKQTEASKIVRKHIAGTVVSCAKLNAQTADRGGGKPTAHTLSITVSNVGPVGKGGSSYAQADTQGFWTNNVTVSGPGNLNQIKESLNLAIKIVQKHEDSSMELPTNTTGKLYSTSSVAEAEGFATQLKNNNSQASGQSREQSAASLPVAEEGLSGLVSNAAISALSTSTGACASRSSGGGGGSMPHDGRSSTLIPTAENAV